MHVIAYVYHWDRATLWLLSKSERKMWVDLIKRQKKEENTADNEDDLEDEDDDIVTEEEGKSMMNKTRR